MQPAFPGANTAADSDPQPASPESRPAASAPTETAECPGRDSVDFECPAYVVGLKASEAKARFCVSESPAKMSLQFLQSAFNITTPSQYATKDDNPFEFKFPEPGDYEVKFDIFVKEAKDLNDVITVIGGNSRVLLRRRYRVSALATRQGALSRLLEPVGRHWKLALLGLALTGLSGLWAEWLRGSQDWPTALGLRAPDYIVSGGRISGELDPKLWETKGAVEIGPSLDSKQEKYHPKGVMLNVEGSGWALPKLLISPKPWRLVQRPLVLHNFWTKFSIYFRADGLAEWVFRAQPGSHGSWRGYRFKLVKTTSTAGTRFRLSKEICRGYDPCEPVLPRLPSDDLTICSVSDLVTIEARVQNDEIHIWLQYLGSITGELSCAFLKGGDSGFPDNSNLFPTGQVVFGGEDAISHFSVYEFILDKLDKSLV